MKDKTIWKPLDYSRNWDIYGLSKATGVIQHTVIGVTGVTRAGTDIIIHIDRKPMLRFSVAKSTREVVKMRRRLAAGIKEAREDGGHAALLLRMCKRTWAVQGAEASKMNLLWQQQVKLFGEPKDE